MSRNYLKNNRKVKEGSKTYFELDPYNRLVETRIGRRPAIVGMREVLDGYFSRAPGSRLVYHLKKPRPQNPYASEEISLKGSWSLNKKEELIFSVDREKPSPKTEQLIFKGQIMDVSSNSLAYSVATHTQEGTTIIYLLQFSGAWQLDERNRLCFKIKEEEDQTKPKPDTLTLEGSWDIDKNYRVIYRHKKNYFSAKPEVEELAFEGRWQITDRNHLSYCLSAASDSRFDFKARLLRADARRLIFALEAGFTQGKSPKYKRLVFSGRWGFSKKLGLFFEVPYAENKMQYLSFGAELRLGKADTFLCALRASNNQPLGIILELKHSIFSKQGAVFLRLLKDKEKAIAIGAGWNW